MLTNTLFSVVLFDSTIQYLKLNGLNEIEIINCTVHITENFKYGPKCKVKKNSRALC